MKIDSSNPYQYPSMDCVIKQCNRFINSTGNSFICFKMFIMEQGKNRSKKNRQLSTTQFSKNWQSSFSYQAQLQYMFATHLCVFDDKTDAKSKLIKRLIVITWLRCPDYYNFVKISACDALSQFNGDPCKLNVSCLNSRN